MKVLQVSKFYPPVMGGIESVAWELTEGLNRAGVATDVLCANQCPSGAEDMAASGYRVKRAASFGMLLSTSIAPSMAWHLRRMSEGCDVVHLHMPDPMAAVAYWLARPRGKLVVHWHSDVIRQRWALKLYEPLQTWILRRADAVIATSEAYAAASLPLQPWRHKVAVVPIGISDDAACADPAKVEAVRRLAHGRRIVFALGRMTYYKGFDVLIDAAAGLADDCAVLIGGDGELLEHYRHLVRRRGLSGRVQLLGHIHDDDLPSLFQACDVFCMPSTVRAEAYGVAMVEAMVMGKPIVASDIAGSGVPWVNVHGTTGLNVPVRDGTALASALSMLLHDKPLLDCYGAAARERYLREFGAERMTQRTLDLYRRLLATP
jgi:glycosyltransferase involved in cell wall biosynthesis